MLVIKTLLTKMLNHLSSLYATFEYVGNVGSTIYNNTWTATDNGMMVIVCQWNNGHAGGYWYIKDVDRNEYVCTISTDYTNQFREGASFPVIKGHRYNSPDKNAVSGANAFFYKIKIGGGTS